jgi:uncharacterized OsmC-like protein
MAAYPASVQLVPADGTERERPFDLRINGRSGAVELKLGDLSGGEALHFALAMCVFNNISREAREQGIALRELSVTADGDFDADELSTGISFSIHVSGEAAEAVLLELARFGAEDSTIAKTLRHATSVALVAIEATETDPA